MEEGKEYRIMEDGGEIQKAKGRVYGGRVLRDAQLWVAILGDFGAHYRYIRLGIFAIIAYSRDSQSRNAT